jgi:hypothetical protein
MPVSYCDVCDKDRDPLEVPGVSCGHDDSHRRTVGVPMIPARITDEMVERAALAMYDRDEAEEAETNGFLRAPTWDALPANCYVHELYRNRARVALTAALHWKHRPEGEN